MFSLDQAICKHCQSFITDILRSSTAPQNGWKTIKSQYAELTFLEKQPQYTITSLKTSARSGCNLCKLLNRKLRKFYAESLKREYCIFIWAGISAKGEFKVGNGKANNYLEHIASYSRPLTIALFRTLPPENHTVSPNSGLSSLPILPHKYLSSQDVISQIKKWMEICCKHHPSCVRPPSTLPKRVIDLGETPGLSKLSLYLSKGEIKPYAALSYSWGGRGKRFMTKKKTLQARCDGFTLKDLPKTLRDGVKVAKALGFQYLWIDSLSIIQNDYSDWIQEGRAMTDIYGKATINICASSSTGSDKGFLEVLSDRGVTIGQMSATDANSGSMIVADVPPKTLDLEAKEVSLRGWIFQERLVSVSTIHYTNEGLIWECVSQTDLKHTQNYRGQLWKSQWSSLILKEQYTAIHKSKRPNDATSARHKFFVWQKWINAYSSRILYSRRDKFPAIAGVASAFAKKFNLTYRAGLWQENLVSDLLWRRNSLNPTLTRPDELVAPTWSWGSVEGQIEYRQVDLALPTQNLHLDIVHCFTEEMYKTAGGTFGELKSGGYIEADGMLQEVVVDTAFHPGVATKPYQECGVSKGFRHKTNIFCMLDELHKVKDRFVACWCLLVGAFDSYGREGAMYLLLERLDVQKNKYRRIGLAETKPWNSGYREVAESGAFVSGKWQRLILV